MGGLEATGEGERWESEENSLGVSELIFELFLCERAGGHGEGPAFCSINEALCFYQYFQHYPASVAAGRKS